MRTSRFPPAQKCSSTNRSGEPCRRWSLRGGTVCEVHGGRLENVKEAALKRVELARAELLGLAPEAVEVVRQGLADDDPHVRRHAAREILSRAAPIPRPGADLTVVATVDLDKRNPSDEIRERLNRIRESLSQHG